MELKKTCSKCGEVKPIDAFNKRKELSDGRNGMCAMCTREYAREYKSKNRERTNLIQRQYRQSETGKLVTIESGKRYRTKHSDRLLNKRLKNKVQIYEQRRRSIDSLSSSYVASIIHKITGLSAKQIPPELIEAKRQQIKLTRLLKELSK